MKIGYEEKLSDNTKVSHIFPHTTLHSNSKILEKRHNYIKIVAIIIQIKKKYLTFLLTNHILKYDFLYADNNLYAAF